MQQTEICRISPFAGPWARQMPIWGMDVPPKQLSRNTREKRRHKPSDLVRLHSYPHIIALVRHILGHDPQEAKVLALCLEKGLAQLYTVRDLPEFQLNPWYAIVVNQVCHERKTFRESVIKAIAVAYKPVRRYAYQKTGNAFQADDIAQSATEKALTKWYQFVPGSNFQDSVNRWVCQIVGNLFIDHKRKSETTRTVYVDQHTEPDHEPEIPDSFDFDKLMSAVNELPKMQRSVIMLMAEGLKIRQVAEQLGISMGYAKELRMAAQVRLSRFNTKGK